MDNYNVSRETIIKLQNYIKLLYKWNDKINLISCKNENEMWQRHIYDSLQLMNFISDKNIHLIDIGSGAGFPGLILSIAGIAKVTLVESNSKKAAFLLQASKLSDNEINILNTKAEIIQLEGDILTARGLTKLVDIFALTEKYKINDKYLLFKGKTYNQELSQATLEWEFDCKLYDSITALNSKILEVTNLKKVNIN